MDKTSLIKLAEASMPNDLQQPNHRLIEPYLNNLKINEFKLDLKFKSIGKEQPIKAREPLWTPRVHDPLS